MDEKYFYTRKLPHWQPTGQTFFVTYRLAGSLPVAVINGLKDEYSNKKKDPENQSAENKYILREQYFHAFEHALEKNLNQPHWLKNDSVASIVLNSLLFNNNKQYTLWCCCIMSNHVHILLYPFPGCPLLHAILQNHKKFTSRESNKVLGRSGTFWAEESYDTIIRDDTHFYNCIKYSINNPVKAGLVKKWTDWKGTWLHPELEKDYRLDNSQV